MHQREPTVVALCGSLRDESKTRIALTEALAAARDAGASTELVDLRDYELPMLNAADSVPDARRLQETVSDADSVLVGTPNYHGSYSGALKNALDYCGRDEFSETVVGLLEVAGGQFPGTALVHLRTVCRTLNAWALPTEVAIPDSNTTVTEDGIRDEQVTKRVARLGSELARYAGMPHYPEMCESRREQTIVGTQTDD
ncbi:NADPH-dependent FMN reductase [Haloferax mucosum ATCC BAA-1512]|uniref:NADPH-dependent FMN reductase n=1 Tax=Haloferax mucosum ATCC BAA-1512 TaxID=662479 RepID=M0I7K2_9EURY|nr:NAD(P)H-dependent oxidoreductase [Haloferax mucosum]ELZ91967.1 NADPH-dependent FMN reductase [Haloferax mucosum ATCC BAA-1512]